MPGDMDRIVSHTSQSSSETEGLLHSSKKPCRSCVDFKTWSKNMSKESSSQRKPSAETSSSAPTAADEGRHDCPLDINELGRSTWGFLHTMAANYPDKASAEEQRRMTSFISDFSHVYPCDMCAYDFRKRLKKHPIEAESQHSLSQWLCRMHNQINSMLGKQIFDCSKVNERWKDGWDDGRCD
ncbi:FAD-linked sulfhydryl oxidase ALR-like isoform X2 [Watersipora subatra]|uniref:FAD-linked sulfhydryl oxidase ALR-like isoform X2 n=1 Tax=Watersipora subatra TaxID=2589382 RepID=UPI00355B99AA